MKFYHAAAIVAGLLMLGGCSTNDALVQGNDMSGLVEYVSDDSSTEIFKKSSEKGASEVVGTKPPSLMSREQQIELAVYAAVTDRVQPILLEQPIERTVYFNFSDSTVMNKWTDLLQRHADYLNSDMSIRLLVVGFTDEKGSPKFNHWLGQRRSSKVCEKLIKLGAREEQLTCVSYGETHPADPGLDDDARARNRRVELLY